MSAHALTATAAQLDLYFDAPALAQCVRELPADAWVDHFVPENYQGLWQVVPLRCSAGATHPIQMIYSDPSATEFVDTAWLNQLPEIQQVLTGFDCEIQVARLMRLGPDSWIKPHDDNVLAVEHGTARIHVPITTNESVSFRVGNRQLTLAEGTCWYLRLTEQHEVRNRGAESRVHLVVDLVVNDWLTEMIATGC